MKKRLVSGLLLVLCLSICSGCVSNSGSTNQKAASHTSALQDELSFYMGLTEMWADLLGTMDLTPEAWKPFKDESEYPKVNFFLQLQAVEYKNDKSFMEKYLGAMIGETPLKITKNMIGLYKEISEDIEMEISKTNMGDVNVEDLKAMNAQSMTLHTVCEELAKTFQK